MKIAICILYSIVFAIYFFGSRYMKNLMEEEKSPELINANKKHEEMLTEIKSWIKNENSK
jgi:large-conductance mechanosensitive channel